MHRDDFRHCLTLPVRWGDMDALGHVNNVQYFRYLESGRVAYLHTLLPAELPPHQLMVLADIRCQFLQQITYPTTLEVATRIERISRRSLHCQAAIYPQGQSQPAATSVGVMVWFDFQAQRSATLPEALRTAIINYERIPPHIVVCPDYRTHEERSPP